MIAEVITGIILGPSVLGHVSGYTENLFPVSSLDTFGVVANIGLIFFMFLMGNDAFLLPPPLPFLSTYSMQTENGALPKNSVFWFH